MSRKKITHSIPKRDLGKVEREIYSFLGEQKPVDVGEQERSLVVRASLEASGIQGPVDLKEILKNLPPIDDRLHEFALRAATEYRKNVEWAEEFNVSTVTVSKWLSNPAVQGYIAAYRFERSLLNHARMLSLESGAYKTLERVFKMRLTSVNVEAIAGTALKVIERADDIRHGREPSKNRGMVNLFFNKESGENEFRNVTPGYDDDLSTKSITELQQEVSELDAMLKQFRDPDEED